MEEQPGHTVTGGPAPPATHAARPGSGRSWPLLLAAVAVGVGGAAAALLGTPDRTASMPSSARSITVTPTVPLPPQELAALTTSPWDAGPLTDPGRRAACLAGLGYPAAVVLGARAVPVNDHPAIVLVLSGDRVDELRALAVWPDCGAGRPGLIAEQVLPRP